MLQSRLAVLSMCVFGAVMIWFRPRALIFSPVPATIGKARSAHLTATGHGINLVEEPCRHGVHHELQASSPKIPAFSSNAPIHINMKHINIKLDRNVFKWIFRIFYLCLDGWLNDFSSHRSCRKIHKQEMEIQKKKLPETYEIPELIKGLDRWHLVYRVPCLPSVRDKQWNNTILRSQKEGEKKNRESSTFRWLMISGVLVCENWAEDEALKRLDKDLAGLAGPKEVGDRQSSSILLCSCCVAALGGGLAAVSLQMWTERRGVLPFADSSSDAFIIAAVIAFVSIGSLSGGGLVEVDHQRDVTQMFSVFLEGMILGVAGLWKLDDLSRQRMRHL